MSEDERPVLRVVRGDPSPEQLAAVVAVVAARAAAERAEAARQAAAVSARPTSAWVDRARALRGPLPHGPGAWRASALPR